LIASTPSFTQPTDNLHHQFLEILPKIQTHAEITFGFIRCPHKKADRVAETVALAWKWFIRLAEQGKEVNQFIVTFCRLVVRAVKSGRKITGMHKSKDALNELAQQRFGFKVERLPASTSCPHESRYGDVDGQEKHDAYEERLKEDGRTPVPDQAAFRADFPDWRSTRTERDRRLMDLLMLGERTQEVARQFGLTAGRVSQKRLEFFQDWRRFIGDEPLAGE